SDTLRAQPFPVFATGRNASGPTKALPGFIGQSISMAGVPVHPGDLVVGDADGVLVVPRQDVARLLEGVEARLAAERLRLEEIERGQMLASWLNAALRAAGMPEFPAK